MRNRRGRFEPGVYLFEDAQLRVIDYMRRVADGDGHVQESLLTIGRGAGVLGNSSVSGAIKILVERGELTVITPAVQSIPTVYRVKPRPAFTSTFESVTHMIPDRNHMGATDELKRHAVSLARVRWLEREVA